MNISYQDKKKILQEVDRIKFADVVYECKKKSEERKLQFLQKENFEELKSVSNIARFIDRFYNIYQSNSLVFSAEVRKTYDELLNDSYVYKWNITVDDIVKKIEQINNEGIIYIPVNLGVFSSIQTINVNIGAYFREELIPIIANSERFESNDPDLLPRLIEGIDFGHQAENYFRRREYHKKKSLLDSPEKKHSELDEKLNEVVDLQESALKNSNIEVDEKETKKVRKKLTKGRVEDEYLKFLFDRTLLSPGKKKMDKYISFFPFLQFLLNDKEGEIFNLYTIEGFNTKASTYTDDDVYYNNDYRKYQKSSVVRILGL